MHVPDLFIILKHHWTGQTTQPTTYFFYFPKDTHLWIDHFNPCTKTTCCYWKNECDTLTWPEVCNNKRCWWSNKRWRLNCFLFFKSSTIFELFSSSFIYSLHFSEKFYNFLFHQIPLLSPLSFSLLNTCISTRRFFTPYFFSLSSTFFSINPLTSINF